MYLPTVVPGRFGVSEAADVKVCPPSSLNLIYK